MVLSAIGFDYKRFNLLRNRGKIFRLFSLRTLTLHVFLQKGALKSVCVKSETREPITKIIRNPVFLGTQSSIRHSPSHQSCVWEKVFKWRKAYLESSPRHKLCHDCHLLLMKNVKHFNQPLLRCFDVLSIWQDPAVMIVLFVNKHVAFTLGSKRRSYSR